MEHQLWKSIVAVLASLSKVRKSTREEFSDEDIVKTYYWSVLHERPTAWACDRRNWPLWARRKELPSRPTMSRRLRRPTVRKLLQDLEERVVAPQKPGLFWMIDGKPLPIGGCSKDRQAGFGRAAGCKAKGYKIHAIVDPQGAVASWRLAPMNKDERVMAKRLIRATPTIQGYLIGDSNYDSNPLHELCDRRGELQLITPRRYGSGHALGHIKHAAGRLRSVERTENPFPKFAQTLLHGRNAIERSFAHATNWSAGLLGLPPWVRTHRRVHRWVQAKLVLTALKHSMRITSYAA